ncbi:MAG: high-affinity branched-chain amino acid ABC transporter permease LivM [Proteobacteria bacterium]|nr:high-affinity branched-chain amino acid ABC transporter permease LivM [Pseudomonadota bacterium]
MQKPKIAQALLATLIAGALTLLLAGPISGLVLQGYDFEAHAKTPLILAALVMIARFVFSFIPAGSLRAKSAKLQPAPQRFSSQAYVLASLLGFALCAALPLFASKYWLSVFIMALIYVLLGLGLNLVVGLAGLLDLGFVGFYAVGAYGYALGFKYLGLGFWGALPAAALTAGLFGAILGFPVLRMHGDYLAIVTLGFGEIIRLLLNNSMSLTGGPNGIDAPPPTFLGWEFKEFASQGGRPFHEVFGLEYSKGMLDSFVYLILLLAVVLTLYGVNRLRKMPIGRAWEALRNDEIACRSLGLNHVTIKLSAFMIGASIGGIAGVFFASYQGFVSPVSFSFFESALVLAIVVLGGMGSLMGVVLSALFLTIMPEILREFSDYRILVFGIAMVLIMIVKPEGLVQLRRPFFAAKER